MSITVGPKSKVILLTADEFAFLTGLTLSPIYRMIRQKQLKAVHNGRWLIPSTEIEKFKLELEV